VEYQLRSILDRNKLRPFSFVALTLKAQMMPVIFVYTAPAKKATAMVRHFCRLKNSGIHPHLLNGEIFK
jgi:hypothetical protein